MDSEKKDFVIENGVLKKYNGKNPIVEIPSGVSKIAVGAFALSPAKQVVIPEGVTELEGNYCGGGAIGIFGAFDSCFDLESVQLPNTLKIIGDCAFSDCKHLKRITIPDHVTHIHTCAFADCSSLEELNFPSGLQVVGDYAFQRCTALKKVLIENPECKIGKCAFHSSGVVEAAIPARYGLYSIFQDCTQLRKVTLTAEPLTKIIPSSWTIDCNGKKTITGYEDANVSLGNKKCDSLRVFAPNCNIKQLGDAKTPALLGLIELLKTGVSIDKSIEQEYVKYAKAQAKRLMPIAMRNLDLLYFMIGQKIISANNIDLYIESAQGCGNIEAVSALLEYKSEQFPSLNLKKEHQEFRKIEKTVSLSFEPQNTEKYINAFFSTKKETGSVPGVMIGLYKGSDTKIVFPTEVKKNKIFGISDRSNAVPQSYSQLESVTIPEGYQYIGKNAFKGCSNLKEIILPSSLENIYDEAFAECTALERIILPISLIRIGKNAFKGCSNLKEIVLPSSLENIYDEAFAECTALERIILPISLIGLGKNVFAGSGVKEIFVKSKYIICNDKRWYTKCPLKTVYCVNGENGLNLPKKYIKEYPQEMLHPIEKLFFALGSGRGNGVDTKKKQLRNLAWKMELNHPIDQDLNSDQQITVLLERNESHASVAIKSMDGRCILTDAMEDVIKIADSILGSGNYRITGGKMLPEYDRDFYSGIINPYHKTIKYCIQMNTY